MSAIAGLRGDDWTRAGSGRLRRCPRCASRWNPISTAAPIRAGGRPRCRTMNTYPDWNKDATNSREDWRNLGSVFPGDKP